MWVGSKRGCEEVTSAANGEIGDVEAVAQLLLGIQRAQHIVKIQERGDVVDSISPILR
jgi:hypothetical protein